MLVGEGPGRAALLAGRPARRAWLPVGLPAGCRELAGFRCATAGRTGRSAIITTADGTLGTRGSVVDLLPTVVQRAKTDVIYASAPLPVLRAVSALAGRYAIPVQALVSEPAMVCGTGLCMGCVLPAVGTDGITRMVRACVDGPVFRGDLVRWDDVGTIPFDALGAPGWKPRGAAPGAAATSAMPALSDLPEGRRACRLTCGPG